MLENENRLADEARSVAPLVTMHPLIILPANTGAVTEKKMFGACLTVLGWIVVEQTWKRNPRDENV